MAFPKEGETKCTIANNFNDGKKMEDNRRIHNSHAKQKSEQKKDTFRKGKEGWIKKEEYGELI